MMPKFNKNKEKKPEKSPSLNQSSESETWDCDDSTFLKLLPKEDKTPLPGGDIIIISSDESEIIKSELDSDFNNDSENEDENKISPIDISCKNNDKLKYVFKIHLSF